MELTALTRYLDDLLSVAAIRDYCPNGLQVEGKAEVGSIITGVTASQALIDAAQDAKADAILVHHGYFWKGEAAPLTGIKGARIRSLIKADLNLLAYHLPLDVHPELGNNAQLARRMGWIQEGTFGDDGIGLIGRPEAGAMPLHALTSRIEVVLDRTPLVIGDPDKRIARVGWCTGAAQSYLAAAIDAGCDVFVSGEVSEPTVHLAREAGVAYVSAGHHATERYGIQALGEHLAARFGLQHRFVDIDNPV